MVRERLPEEEIEVELSSIRLYAVRASAAEVLGMNLGNEFRGLYEVTHRDYTRVPVPLIVWTGVSFG